MYPGGAESSAHEPPAHLSQVADSLFVGGYDAASSLPALRHARITHIVNATAEYADWFPQHFAYLRIRARDRRSERLAPYFDDVAAFVRDAQAAGGRVLIHCQEGISRSATLALACFIINGHQSLAAAFAALRAARPAVEPAPNFLQELRALERRLFDGVASMQRLTPADVPSETPDDMQSEVREEVVLLTSRAAIAELPAAPDVRRSVMLLREADEDTLRRCICDAVYRTFDAYATLEHRAVRARIALAHFFAALVAAGVLSQAQLVAALEDLWDSEMWQEFASEDVPYALRFARELMQELE